MLQGLGLVQVATTKRWIEKKVLGKLIFDFFTYSFYLSQNMEAYKTGGCNRTLDVKNRKTPK